MPARLCLLACTLACAAASVQQAASQAAGSSSPVSPEASSSYSAGRDSPLGLRIQELLGPPETLAAHWGIAVASLSGQPVFGWNEQQLFRPASTAKLFTTAAALALLGPAHTVTTTIVGNLDRSTGTVDGDLTLVGAGDPSFGTTDLPFRESPPTAAAPDPLDTLADRLVASGVRHIQGSIVGDDTLFGREPAPEGWAAEDLVWGYGTLLSALSIDNNQLRLQVAPGDPRPKDDPDNVGASPRSGPTAFLDQRVDWVRLTQNLSTLPPAEPQARHIGVITEGDSPQTLHVFGTMPAGAPPVVEEIALNDPAAYAAAALKQLLVARGVLVDGTTRALHANADDARPFLQVWRGSDTPESDASDASGASEDPRCSFHAAPTATSNPRSVLLTQPSGPLRDEVVYTLKTSSNLHAEMLLHQLASQSSCPGQPAVYGAAQLRRWLLQVGLREQDFVLYDGSGLSAKDLVTPRAEVQLLAYAAGQPWFTAWKAGLPVGGVDGTLANRFTSPTLRGRVAAKTGTLGESRALAGYLQCQSGQVLIFSILVDNHEPDNTADRATMDAIVAAIAATQ